MTEVPLKVCGRHKLPQLVQEIRGSDGHFAFCRMGPVYFSAFFRKNFLLMLLYLFIFYEKKEEK